MLNNEMWNIFKKTGNIEAYLYCKQYNKVPQLKENHNTTTQIQLMAGTKINSL